MSEPVIAGTVVYAPEQEWPATDVRDALGDTEHRIAWDSYRHTARLGIAACVVVVCLPAAAYLWLTGSGDAGNAALLVAVLLLAAEGRL